MNKQLYNQISVKLYEAFKTVTELDEKSGPHSDENVFPNQSSFVRDLEIDDRAVKLFQAIYVSEKSSSNGYVCVDEIFQAVRAMFPMPKRLKFYEGKTLAEKGRLFAIQAHRDVDQQYGDKLKKAPYEYHLWRAVQYFHKYKYYIPKEYWDIVEAAIWCHDVVEDGHKTYNDIKKSIHEMVAKLACALSTNIHGHNRVERADDSYYTRILSVELGDLKVGVFAKLCDRLANVSEAGGMVETYQRENPEFLKKLGPEIEKYPNMIDELLNLLNLKNANVSVA